jgi:hypothetical protein
VLVADTGNHRVLEFELDGAFVGMLGSGVKGGKDGQLYNPCDVAVLPSGDVAVADQQVWLYSVAF